MAASPSSWVLHVDLDQFLAAVEVRRRPELAGRPVVVGGDGNPQRPRQVVATASYEARAFGIRSGMPLGQALRRCPDAVFLPSDRPAYDAASAEVMATLRTLSGRRSRCGAGTRRSSASTTDDPEAFAHEVKARVAAATGLSCAVGIGETRLLAKTATGFAKPGGVARLTRREWIPTMGAEARHRHLGHRNRARPRAWASSASSPSRTSPAPTTSSSPAASARRSARTCACSASAATTPRSSTSRTSPAGAARRRRSPPTSPTPTSVAAHVERLAREVTAAVVAEGRRVTHVAVKVRTATFFTRTKISKLPAPTTDPDEVAAHGDDRARPIRRAPSGAPARRAGRPRDAGVDP